jgi:hypothetical protein
VRLTLRLYTVENGAGRFVSQPDPAEPIPFGWYARLDVTGKDEDNVDTNGEVEPEWHLSDPSLVRVTGSHTHQRRLQVKAEGILECWVTQQGVRSNTITLRLAR